MVYGKKSFNGFEFYGELAIRLGLIPWCCLVFMSYRWIMDNKIDKNVPTVGTVLGLICIIMTIPTELLALPGTFFDWYFVTWHLEKNI